MLHGQITFGLWPCHAP